MKRAGPYKVVSASNGTLHVVPSWPLDTGEDTGPGVFSRMGLAHDLESYLNAVYPTGTTPERLEGADG